MKKTAAVLFLMILSLEGLMSKEISKPEKIYAYYLAGLDSTVLMPDRGDKAEILPDQLVIKPGVYQVKGRVYNLNKEGLYRFIQPGDENLQRIVYQKDVISFVSALCWIHSHGTIDDENWKDVDGLIEKAKTGKLIMTCGPFSNFASKLLTANGIRARSVSSRVMVPENEGDDGHVLVEAFVNGRWVLFDVDSHMMFKRNGRYLNLLDMVIAVRENDYELVKLSSAPRLAVGSFKENGYDYGFWMEASTASDKSLQRWYKRVLRLPRFGLDITCPKEERDEMKKNWPDNIWVSENDFREKYYSEDKKEN